MKKNLKKLKKFLGTKAGFIVMFFVVLPLFALSATAGAMYFNNLNKSTPPITAPGGIVPLVTTPTNKTQPVTTTNGSNTGTQSTGVERNSNGLTPQGQAEVDATQKQIDQNNAELAKIARCRAANDRYYKEYVDEKDRQLAAIQVQYDKHNGMTVEAYIRLSKEVYPPLFAIYNQNMINAGCPEDATM